MGEHKEQQLSALADGELSEFEVHRLLEGLRDDEVSRTTLARYRLMGDAMRQTDETPLLSPAFTAGVAQAVDRLDSTVDDGRQTGLWSSWKRPLAGLAVAASVAMVSIVLTRFLASSGVQQAPALQLAAQPAEQMPISSTAAPSSAEGVTYWHTLSPEMEKKLNRYLVDHAGVATGKGMDRMLPYASFVSYDRRH
jgi:sigma-E factor negative regulatory protein RseA